MFSRGNRINRSNNSLSYGTEFTKLLQPLRGCHLYAYQTKVHPSRLDVDDSESGYVSESVCVICVPSLFKAR